MGGQGLGLRTAQHQGEELSGPLHQVVGALLLQFGTAAEPPQHPAGVQLSVFPGLDIHIAVPHKEGGVRLSSHLLHEGIEQGGVGLGGLVGQCPLDVGEHSGVVPLHHRPSQGVGLVGEHADAHPRLL